jgi:hypothetical protein
MDNNFIRDGPFLTCRRCYYKLITIRASAIRKESAVHAARYLTRLIGGPRINYSNLYCYYK